MCIQVKDIVLHSSNVVGNLITLILYVENLVLDYMFMLINIRLCCVMKIR